MKLQFTIPFHADSNEGSLIESFPSKLAVFALFPNATASRDAPPYLSRTVDLRRRLGRLLGTPREKSKMLNLREFTRRIDYQCVGSAFEAQWLLYLLNKAYYPHHYRRRLRLKPPVLLKVNLRNRFPRCYPTRRLSQDGSLYYGPFPSLAVAEHFAAAFLDLFEIRRCSEELKPNPSHPGCIYSQMRMCLAPCFGGCTDQEYQQELEQVVGFLDGGGQALIRALEAERAEASEALAFEQAAKLHRKLEKVREVLRLKPGLVHSLRELHALVVVRGAEPKSVVFFRACSGEIRGPGTLVLDENVASPSSLDAQLQGLLDTLAPKRADAAGLPPWEHLSLLARWYYSSFREGTLLMLPPSQEIPHARLIRLCRKVLAGETPHSPPCCRVARG